MTLIRSKIKGSYNFISGEIITHHEDYINDAERCPNRTGT